MGSEGGLDGARGGGWQKIENDRARKKRSTKAEGKHERVK